MMHLEKFVAVAISTFVVVTFVIAPRKELKPPQDQWFEDRVIYQSNPVLVKFGAEWCGPCKMMDSVLNKYDQQMHGNVHVVKIDISERPDLAEYYHVGPIPRLMLFHEGKVIAQDVGSRDLESLKLWVDSKL